METAAKGGQAKPETGNATSFNWWFFTIDFFFRVISEIYA
jgi:hypothetical protein